MTELSPAAQAVNEAAKESSWLWDQMCPADYTAIAVATLRAVANQTMRPDPVMGINSIIHAKDILAIAAELEAM